jgi:uncharacterized protein YycO
MRPKILLFRGRGFFSQLIRWQTRSRYSHAAFLLPDGRVLEAWHSGVRIAALRSWRDIEAFDVQAADAHQWAAVMTFARAQVGRGYDFRGVLRFLSRRRQPHDEQWFCSELVFAALQHAGVDLLRDTDPAEVSPGMLARSPLLSPVSL